MSIPVLYRKLSARRVRNIMERGAGDRKKSLLAGGQSMAEGLFSLRRPVVPELDAIEPWEFGKKRMEHRSG